MMLVRRNRRHSRAGFTLIELVVVIAILAIGFGLATTMLVSGNEVSRKVSIRTQDRQVSSIVSQVVANELRYSNEATLFDAATQTPPATQIYRIMNVGNRIVKRTYTGLGFTSSELIGQTDLTATYVVSLAMTRSSNKTVSIIVTVYDSARDLTKYPAYTTTTSILIENLLGAPSYINLLPGDATEFDAISYRLP